MTKEQILKILNDKSTYILDFKDITHNAIEFEDFNDVADAILILFGVVRQSEQLKDGHKNSFKYWLEENNYKKVYDKYVKWGFEYSESDLIYKYNEELMNL